MPRIKKERLKKRSDGRYKCKYHGKQFYGSTMEEAIAKRDKYKRLEVAGEYKRQNPTVSEYIEHWLPLHKADVSPKTYSDYKKQLQALADAVGADTYLRALSVDDAAKVWVHYRGYSASTIHRAKMLYTALFDSAIENDICRKNPFRGRFAQPPKAPSGTHRALTDEEIRLIQTTPHRAQLAALVMLYAGLRRGEVLALTKRDLVGNTIKYKRITRYSKNHLTYATATRFYSTEIIVDKAVRFVGNKPTIEPPKTAAGVRRVPVFRILRRHLANAPQRILSANNGSLITSTAWRNAWNNYNAALSAAAGHPVSIRAHDLRHTYCTMLRDAGVDMHQAMLWMGHSDEKMILHVYDHITDNRTQTSINLVEKSLFGVQNGVQADEK